LSIRKFRLEEVVEWPATVAGADFDRLEPHVEAKPLSGHSGARPQAESVESMTTVQGAWILGSPLLRRPQ
jgi:hypothetical protein